MSAVKCPKNVLLISLALALITLALYWPVRHHAFIDFDDPLYVTDNVMVQQGLTLEGLRWAFSTDHAYNWHPLTWLSHMLDCELFGLNPAGHHLTNVLFHLANALLVFLLLTRITGFLWRSAAVAALFALHPLRVESVAWVAERKDVFCLFFWLLATWAYGWYVERPDRRRYLVMVLACAVSILTKPMIVTLPFALLLLDFWPLRRIELPAELAAGQFKEAARNTWPVARRLLIEKIPLFVLSAGLSAVTCWIQSEEIMAGQRRALLDRCANAVVSYLRYLGKLFWPTDLVLPYPHPGSWPLATTIAGTMLLTALTVMILRAAGTRRYLLVGWLWYLGTLVPVIGLVQVGGQAMADRYTYIPMIGIVLMLVWGVADLLETVPQRRWILSALAGLAIAGCLITTTRQLGYWRNSETLFRHAIGVSPKNAIAQFNLGLALANEKRHREAIEHYLAGLALSPKDAKGYYNLGHSLVELGRYREAIPQYTEALRLKPDRIDTHVALGLALVREKNLDGAIAHFEAAIELKPDQPPAHNNLGNVLYLAGRVDEAIRHYARAIQLDPSKADAIVNLAIALNSKGRPDEAAVAISRALQLKPKDAALHHQLAVFLIAAGKLGEAVHHYREAARLKPDWPQPLSELAWLLATHPNPQIRNGPAAVELARRASELTRDRSPGPLDALAAACAEAGRYADAVSHAQQALALAQEAGQKGLAAEIEGRLKMYQAGKPYRTP